MENFKLETLDIKETKFEELPSGIAKLQHAIIILDMELILIVNLVQRHH
jgi:hypothetical protein